MVTPVYIDSVLSGFIEAGTNNGSEPRYSEFNNYSEICIHLEHRETARLLDNNKSCDLNSFLFCTFTIFSSMILHIILTL